MTRVAPAAAISVPRPNTIINARTTEEDLRDLVDAIRTVGKTVRG